MLERQNIQVATLLWKSILERPFIKNYGYQILIVRSTRNSGYFKDQWWIYNYNIIKFWKMIIFYDGFLMKLNPTCNAIILSSHDLDKTI